VTVDEDERVDGPVVAVFGSVIVNGMVTDNVVAVGGNVHLGPTAEVRGDVTSVGGGLTRDEGSVVTGQINEVDFRVPHVRIRPVKWWPVSVGPWWIAGARGALFAPARMTLFAAARSSSWRGAVGRIERTIRALSCWPASAQAFSHSCDRDRCSGVDRRVPCWRWCPSPSWRCWSP
jgi:hypothetical protein